MCENVTAASHKDRKVCGTALPTSAKTKHNGVFQAPTPNKNKWPNVKLHFGRWGFVKEIMVRCICANVGSNKKRVLAKPRGSFLF